MKLLPNKEIIRPFLENLYGVYDDPSVIMAFRCLEDGQAIEQRFALSDISIAVKWVADCNQAGWNTYVTAARVKPRTKRKFVTDDDMAENPWLVADADDPDALENIKNYSPAPHMLISIGLGRGWGIWLADVSATNKNTHEKRHAARAKYCKTDPAVTNIGRIIPIPGTVRWQPESKRAKGYVDGLITFEYTPGKPLDTGRLLNPAAKFKDAIDCSETTISEAYNVLSDIGDGN